MNLEEIKSFIKSQVNKCVEVKISSSRNKSEVCKGIITNAYPNIFTLHVSGENKSFRYGDIITGDVKFKFK